MAENRMADLQEWLSTAFIGYGPIVGLPSYGV
jgi:hypothetical protein